MATARRKLGNTGLEIAPLVFGGNVFDWTADEATSLKLLDAFVDADFNAIDTADVYSKWAPGHVGGESETVIGKWLKQSGKRDRVVIATKVGMELGPNDKGLSKAYILRAAERSLERLQTDYIDLYQAHLDDAATPLDETLSAFAELIQAGKVRAIGASNYSAPRLAAALQVAKLHGLPSYQTLQPQYNLYDRADYEINLALLCQQHGLGVIAYFALASGFLTGKYRSLADTAGKARAKTLVKYLNERGLRILAALDEVAKETGTTPAQVSLAWLMAQPSVTAPIASATNLAQLDDLLAAARLVLDASVLHRLHQASAY